jgi:peptidoglycan/xylan/chitin deacetylase (PgdA/CDA1 family)
MSILLLGPFQEPTPKSKPKTKPSRLPQLLFATIIFGLGLLIGVLTTYQWHNALAAPSQAPSTDTPLDQVLTEIVELNSQIYQKPHNLAAQTKLDAASKLALHGRFDEAYSQLAVAKKMLQSSMTSQSRQAFIPIVLYHKKPDDFDAQLRHIKNRGYTTISMQQVGDYLRGYTELPAKPVVLTFDDGYSDSLQIAQQLASEQLRGTFYLIIGGDASRHCIGPERTDLSCGDSFLNWAEIEAMSKLPSVEVGVHTVDHADLPTLSPMEQMWQIVAAKNQLEQRTGLKLTTFAYPYGHFNATTVELVKSAGLETAVTTVPGSTQTTSDLYTLHRVRTTLDLP